MNVAPSSMAADRSEAGASPAVDWPAGALGDAPAGHGDNSRLSRSRFGATIGSAGLSIAIHGAMLAALALVGWRTVRSEAPPITEYHAKIVTMPAVPDETPQFHFPGQARLDRPDDSEDDVTAASPAETLEDLAALLNRDEVKMPAAAAPGPAEPRALESIKGTELRRSDVIGVGTGGGKSAGRNGGGLGRRNVTGGGPVGALWGVGEGQRARSIVYVLDRSGSMQEMLDVLKAELRKAIGTLESDQTFNVIWFKSSEYSELFDRVVPATIANKKKAFDALRDIQAEGHTNPMGALRRAFSFRPDVLFLISDADFFPLNDQVVVLIHERNRRLATTVNTILIVYDQGGAGERVEEAINLFRTIAHGNNGAYKRVTGLGGRDD